MATAVENLITARDNAAARLAEITASQAPTYTENGRTVNRTEYMTALQAMITSLNQQIAAMGPFEVRTRMSP